MKNVIKVVLMVPLVVTGWHLAGAQAAKTTLTGAEVEEIERRRLELGDLYPRLANSQLVVIGTVVARDYVVTNSRPPSIDADVSGKLYAVQVEKTVCRQEDFQSPENAGQHPEVGPTLYFFVPFPTVVTKPENFVARPENMEVGERYLLFIVIPDNRTQSEWTGQFRLDKEKVYVRGQEFSRGIIHLPKPENNGPPVKNPEVLDKVQRICQAVQPTTVREKIDELSKLRASNDEILRQAAAEAIQALGSRGK